MCKAVRRHHHRRLSVTLFLDKSDKIFYSRREKSAVKEEAKKCKSFELHRPSSINSHAAREGAMFNH